MLKKPIQNTPQQQKKKPIQASYIKVYLKLTCYLATTIFRHCCISCLRPRIKFGPEHHCFKSFHYADYLGFWSIGATDQFLFLTSRNPIIINTPNKCSTIPRSKEEKLHLQIHLRFSFHREMCFVLSKQTPLTHNLKYSICWCPVIPLSKNRFQKGLPSPFPHWKNDNFIINRVL